MRLQFSTFEERSLPSAAQIEMIGDWVQSLQYQSANPYVDGAIRIHHTVGRTEPNTAYMVDPYFANLAVIGLLRSSYSQKFEVASDWINWYFNNLNANGTMDRHWYTATGDIPMLLPTTEADAEDSAASTFLQLVDTYIDAGFGAGFFNTDIRRYRLAQMGHILTTLQQDDGLTWASWDYPVKYLQDNSESYIGLRSMARIARDILGDDAKANTYAEAAERCRTAITTKMYNSATERFYYQAETSLFTLEEVLTPADFSNWYPRATSALWPALFDVVEPGSSIAQTQFAALNAAYDGSPYPDWTTTQLASPEAGFAALLAGETTRATEQMNALFAEHFSNVNDQPTYPFVSGSASWMLQTLMPNVLMQHYTGTEDGSVTGTIVGYDLQNDPLTFSVATPPAHGTLTQFNPTTGAFTYVPNAEYTGADAFQVQATDGVLTAWPATIRVTVLPVNDPPSFSMPNTLAMDEDAPLQVHPMWANNILLGPANEVLQTGQFLVSTTNATLFAEVPTIEPNGTLRVRPATNAFGTATVSVQLQDDGGTANGGQDVSSVQQFTIHVLPINDPPLAMPDTASLRDGATVLLNVLNNDSDPEGNALAITSFTYPLQGQLVRLGNTFRYTANRNAHGTDQFSYLISDGFGGSATTTVTLTLQDLTKPTIQRIRLHYGSASVSRYDLLGATRSILPWANIRRFEVTFSEDVAAGLAGQHLTLLGWNNVPYHLTFTYDAQTRTGTWSLPQAMGRERAVLRLHNMSDGRGNFLGGTWSKVLRVLPGDFDGNGVVNTGDIYGIERLYPATINATTRWADIDGNGLINAADRTKAFQYFGQRAR